MRLRYGLLITLFLLAIIGFLFYERQHLPHKLKREQLENEKLNAELELSLAMMEIKDFTQNIKDKNEQILDFASEIEVLKNQSITNEQQDEIAVLKQSAVLTDKDLNNFSAVFERAYPGYLARLQQKYPELTTEEIRIFILVKLETGTRDMEAILGKTADAIRHTQLLVQEKINMGEAENFEKFVRAV